MPQSDFDSLFVPPCVAGGFPWFAMAGFRLIAAVKAEYTERFNLNSLGF